MYGSAFHELLDTLYSKEEFVSSKAVELWPKVFDKEAGKSAYSHISREDKEEYKEFYHED